MRVRDSEGHRLAVQRGPPAREVKGAVYKRDRRRRLDGIGFVGGACSQHLHVSARRFVGDARDTWPLSGELRALGAELVAWPDVGRAAEFEAFAREADIVVQATSAGMHGADSGATIAAMVPWRLLPKGASAYDLVYNPRETEFLRAADAASVRSRGGLGMLVRQAALAFEIWLGVRPPLEPLFAAAEAALEKRSR